MALTVQRPPLDNTHSYKIKGVILTYDWKQHDINTPMEHLNPTLNSISKLQRNAHIFLSIKYKKSRETLDIDAYEYFKTTSPYTPEPTIIPMIDQFIQFLEFFLDIEVFPKLLKYYLELGQMQQPYLLINTFGGILKALTKRLCGSSPSFFLYNNMELTKKLIIFSRQELAIALPIHSIPIQEWGKKTKYYRYDAEFY